MGINAVGTIVVNIKNKSQFRFHLKCPVCGGDLAEQFKSHLYISEDKKYLPLNALIIYDDYIKFYSHTEVKTITTDCCNLKMVYNIFPQKIKTRNVSEAERVSDIFFKTIKIGKTLLPIKQDIKTITDGEHES